MIDRKTLLTDLKKQVGALEGDLRERAADDPDTHARLYGEWQRARTASRIAATYESWLDDRVTQAAVAWVLGTVFLRFCEDNGLVEVPFLAGPGERLDLAQERQAEYIRKHPHDTDRDWILAGFAEMSRSPVAAGLFDKAHNPMWQIEIPHHAAKALLGFWRRRGEDGEIVHDFTDPEWDTRFLGDLYQDLSEHAKKTYALLQTPEFVEEFILDYTLEPAVDEFGLAGLRLIDPTCGSGHFLLGAFHRILNKWRNAEPATDIWELIRRTLLSVHGVDKNPFATNIARFRLLTAVMKAGGISTLARVPEFPIIVATGDSLLHGRGAPGIQEDLLSEPEPHTYVTEDIYGYISKAGGEGTDVVDLLGVGSYHIVVGNPPYITVKDRQENQNYRSAYKACSGKYALSVPFVERFFQLARRGGEGASGAGIVGQITANSFMKREFGKKLVEEYLPTVEISRLIDASGAYIPGHGTPTVILFGKRRWPKRETSIRVIMGLRAEPEIPADPASGLVWREIVEESAHPTAQGEWVSGQDVSRERFGQHPWNLSGGGAVELQDRIERDNATVNGIADRIGVFGIPGADDVIIAPRSSFDRMHVESDVVRDLCVGDNVRDWTIKAEAAAFFPYDSMHVLLNSSLFPLMLRRLWPYRTDLGNRATFDGGTYITRGRPWYEWHQLPRDDRSHEWSITFGEVATHNHFALDRSGRTFKQTAPIIKLSRDASEQDFLGLLAVLNSSVVCFWLKQVCHKKGGSGMGRGIQPEAWMERYAFNGANVGDIPLPKVRPTAVGSRMDALASEAQSHEPQSLVSDGRFNELAEAKSSYLVSRARMVALQEELDWEVYSLYGLLRETVTASADCVPEIRPGERAFEIVLARRLKAGEAGAEWFQRHGSNPIVEIPQHWPESYRRVVEKRIEIIESRRDIALIERPEFKRRWVTESWEKQEKVALRTWLLDRCEERCLWFADDEYGTEQPRVMTGNQLADQLRQNEDFMSVARLYAGDDADLAKVISEITQDTHVPHLAALRYKESPGLRIRAQWVDVWEKQREEDRTGKQLDIPVPPKYSSADFLKLSYWRNRGKLDVPKERFISYPGSGPDGDSSMLLGWAGWDHREQAQALMMLIEERATQDGWDAARLTPLLAGLAEVLPWVRQWHGEVDPAFGQSPADAYANYLETKQRELGISDDDLKNWRPEKPKRGGRRKKTS